MLQRLLGDMRHGSSTCWKNQEVKLVANFQHEEEEGGIEEGKKALEEGGGEGSKTGKAAES